MTGDHGYFPVSCPRRLCRLPGIKLDCVATDILGVSGRAMLDALCQGTTDPVVLVDLAKGRMRTKIPALREALEGRASTSSTRC